MLNSRRFLGSTASIGKDHFGWDAATPLPPLDPKCEEHGPAVPVMAVST